MTGTPEEIVHWLFNQDKDKVFEIKEHREKRSLDANSYMWTLCKKIADKLRITKEEVYREQIKNVGQFEILPIRNDAVDTFIRSWVSRGIGWVCEILSSSKLDGYTNVIAYYGSSVYDTNSMSVLIDSVVEEAKALNIETRTPEEIAKIKSLWEGLK